MKHIDYSQYSSWMHCPWQWYEKYVGRWQKNWIGQRSDALCLGSLVHSALDTWKKSGRVEIPPEAITDNNPTPETVSTAMMLVEGYIRKYPSEEFKIEATEQPVEFPLRSAGVLGLAKLDGYFHLDDTRTLEMGLPGETITLTPGWWAREYKTKSWDTDRPKWIREWTSKMQADFQMLALQNLVGETPQGVMVCVLEKPHQYTPKRKCKACGQQWELASFIETGEGLYACPMCGEKQKVSPYEPKVPKTPEYFRILATRSEEQLERSRSEIDHVASMMEEAEYFGRNTFPPNRDACIQNRYHRECEFARVHIPGLDPGEAEGYVQVDTMKYMGV